MRVRSRRWSWQRSRKDLHDQFRILQDDTYQRLERLLVGKVVDGGPAGLKAGGRITQTYLDDLPREKWFEIRLKGEDVNVQLEKAAEHLKQQREALDERYNEKYEKLTSGDDLAPGVLKMVKVYLAVKRRIQPGDKMAGRHGNKGVISMIVPVEDMPYMEDGTPVDIVLNPLGVPSRMNVGQVLETHLGWATKELGKQVAGLLESAESASTVRSFLGSIYEVGDKRDTLKGLDDSEVFELARNVTQGIPMATPVFDGASEEEIKKMLDMAGLPNNGQTLLYDGRTGDAFDRPGDGRLHVHDEAQSSGRRQDACAIDRSVQLGDATTLGWQGAIWRSAIWRDGGMGARSLWRILHPAGDAHGEVGRCERTNQDVQEHRGR